MGIVAERIEEIYPSKDPKAIMTIMRRHYSLRHIAKRIVKTGLTAVWEFCIDNGIPVSKTPVRYTSLVRLLKERGEDEKKVLEDLHAELGSWPNVAKFLGVGPTYLRRYRIIIKLPQKRVTLRRERKGKGGGVKT